MPLSINIIKNIYMIKKNPNKKKTNNLLVKQEKFCQEYVQHGNASRAYRNSYECPKASVNTINTNAYKMLNKPYIAHRIEQLQELTLERHQVTIDRIITEYAKIAFVDIGQIFNSDGTLKPLNEIDAKSRGAITSIEVEEKIDTQEEYGSTTIKVKKIRLADKRAALSDLSEYLGMFVKKFEEINKNPPVEINIATIKPEEAADIYHKALKGEL